MATREQLPKKDLIRVVKNKEGQVFVDLSGKQNGRGAYLKKDAAALKTARKKNSLGIALQCAIPDEIYAKLEQIIALGGESHGQ